MKKWKLNAGTMAGLELELSMFESRVEVFDIRRPSTIRVLHNPRDHSSCASKVADDGIGCYRVYQSTYWWCKLE